MASLIGYIVDLAKMTKGKELKGYKVTNVTRTRKIGVASRSLRELKRKACQKFNVPDNEDVAVYLTDGSEIDEEYFATLEPQTALVLRRPGERFLTEADLLYELLRKVNSRYLRCADEAAEFLTEKLKSKIAILNRTLNLEDGKTLCSSRKDHPEWFEGLDTHAQTKEAYLHRRCQDRIRGYLYKTIEQIRASEIYARDPGARRNLLRAIAFFKIQLKRDHYFGHYFDRSRANDRKTDRDNDDTDGRDANSDTCPYDHCPCRLSDRDYDRFVLGQDGEDERQDVVDARKASSNKRADGDECEEEKIQANQFKLIERKDRDLVALCDSRGEFRCNGVWNSKTCKYGDKHKINPYRSKEELILFSTWNLDHRIERSRTLVPKLLEVSRTGDISEKVVVEFYDNLFTCKNLRLVHIICHDKGSHAT